MSTSVDQPPPALEVTDLLKRYSDGTVANAGISFRVERGEFLAILGPNGAGKTTLVRQITTELLSTSGHIRVLGQDVSSSSTAVKACLGVIPQEASLFWNLSVWHHLRIFAKLRGLPPAAAAERAEELLASLGLCDHRDKPAQTLSGGLRRRVLLGIAMVTTPPLMILDEPSTGLDPQSRRDLWTYIRQQKSNGTAVVLTTHYMEEAEQLCDRVGIILAGRLIALDTVSNLRATHGLEFKLTHAMADDPNQTRTIYGASNEDLVQQAQQLHLKEYAIARADLEDVYLALTDGKEPALGVD